MSNPAPRPTEPAPPARPDHATETAAPGAGTTGVIPDAADRQTVVSPGPAAAGSAPRLGEFVVVRQIGEGGMGAVYLAEDPHLGRRVALKTMRPELAANPDTRARFAREARAAAAVEHDNIVPILQVGETPDGTPFLVMPFLQGESLDDRLRRTPVAGLPLLLKVAKEVSDGLAAAHAVGLIHRDIKPANIWLEGDRDAKETAQQVRRCKILDFGLARAVDAGDAQLTATGAVMGTPTFMAPEQARGEKVDHRADLWSLGVVLYRMATGRLPFNGPTPMAVLIALATGEPPRAGAANPNLPPEVAALIDRLMCREPAGRPPAAAEVAAAVRRIIKDIKARPPGTPVPGAGSAPAWEVVNSAPKVQPPPLPPARPRADPVPADEPGPAEVPDEPRAELPRARVVRRLPLDDDRPRPRRRPEGSPRDREAGGPSRRPWLIAAGVGVCVAAVAGCLLPLYWIGTLVTGTKSEPTAAVGSRPGTPPPGAKTEVPPPKGDGPLPPPVAPPAPAKPGGTTLTDLNKLERLGTPGPWRSYTGDGFAAQFPGVPETKTVTEGGMSMKLVGVGSDDTMVAAVFVLDLPPQAAQQAGGGQALLNAFTGNKPSTNVTVDGRPGKEVDLGDATSNGRMRLVLAGNRLYGFIAAVPKKGTAATPADVSRFFNSVRITSK